MSYWKKLKTETIFTHPRITLVEDTVELPNGKQTPYLRYEGLKDYVTVIAQEDGKILLLKEYAYPHDEWLWQFPEGDIETGEDPQKAAIRELAEEADLVGEEAVQIGFNYDHHRRTPRKDYVITVTGLSEDNSIIGDEEEADSIEKDWFTVEQINQMIANGEIRQKNILAAWPIFLAHTGGSKQI